LSFLYEKSPVKESFPQFFMISFPLSFLFGPTLFYYFKFFMSPKKTLSIKALWHLIPFFILTVVTGYLFSMTGQERVLFIRNNIYSLIVPVNYIKVTHILSYGFVIFFMLKKNSGNLVVRNRNYIYVILFLYLISAFLQASFYASFLRYSYFIMYHFLASTLIIFVGYILYFHRDILEKINIKYSKSSLSKADKERIHDKIEHYISSQDNILDKHLSLAVMSKNIDEKKHHISQTISEVFGTSFNDLINRERINYSKTLLLDPYYDKFKILGIAMESGFSNKVTFNRAFLKYNLCTPSEFRKNR